jgi:hypothetical protein
VPLGEQSAGDVHRNLATELCRAFVDHPARFAILAEAEVLVVQDLRRGKTVMQLDEI